MLIAADSSPPTRCLRLVERKGAGLRKIYLRERRCARPSIPRSVSQVKARRAKAIVILISSKAIDLILVIGRPFERLRLGLRFATKVPSRG